METGPGGAATFGPAVSLGWEKMPVSAERDDDAGVEFAFDLLPGNEPPYDYAPGHVTITTRQGTGTSRPSYPFMLAVSLTDLLSGMKAFLLHGKMSGIHWSVVDAAFSVYFQRVTRRLKGQKKPIRIVCGGVDLGTVFEEELLRSVAGGTRRFLQTYGGSLGEDEADLVPVFRDFVTAFGLEDDSGA